jgi:hypothetical protein
MVYCHIAFRIVENEYFRDLIKFLSSSLGGLLPRAASTIRGWMMEAYLAEKVTVERELQRAVSNIHLSFDGWTSPNNYSILSVFAHFIDSGGVRRTRLLAFRRTYGAKSAENEAAALLKVIKEYNIEQRLDYFTCDNISTNDALIDLILLELHPHWTTKQRESCRLRCLGHVANICARASLLGAGAGKALATLKAKIEKGRHGNKQAISQTNKASRRIWQTNKARGVVKQARQIVSRLASLVRLSRVWSRN